MIVYRYLESRSAGFHIKRTAESSQRRFPVLRGNNRDFPRREKRPLPKENIWASPSVQRILGDFSFQLSLYISPYGRKKIGYSACWRNSVASQQRTEFCFRKRWRLNLKNLGKYYTICLPRREAPRQQTHNIQFGSVF